MRKFEVWSEGYRTNGNSGGPMFHGSFEAESFQAACDMCFSGRAGPGLYHREAMTYWGCKLFESEKDARAGFDGGHDE